MGGLFPPSRRFGLPGVMATIISQSGWRILMPADRGDLTEMVVDQG